LGWFFFEKGNISAIAASMNTAAPRSKVVKSIFKVPFKRGDIVLKSSLTVQHRMNNIMSLPAHKVAPRNINFISVISLMIITAFYVNAKQEPMLIQFKLKFAMEKTWLPPTILSQTSSLIPVLRECQILHSISRRGFFSVL